MCKSVYLYKELVKHSSKILTDYLKDVPTFENQLKFEKINEVCYQEMYGSIKDKESIKPVQEMYGIIDGLKELYKKARTYYLKPRNRSIRGLDVQLGKQFEEVFIKFLNSKGIVAMRADSENRRLPDIMVLDKTKNIKAYIELKYHNAPFMLAWKLLGREPYEGSITLDTEKLKRQLIEIDTELERPVYFVHWVDFPDLKGIFFNTHDQIKEYLNEDSVQFVRKTREGDYREGEYELQAKVGYTDKFYPPLHEMGNFEELLQELKP